MHEFQPICGLSGFGLSSHPLTIVLCRKLWCIHARNVISVALVKEALSQAQGDADFEWHEVEIEVDSKLQQKYNEEVPVVFIDGRKAFKYQMDSHQFLRVLAGRAGQNDLRDNLVQELAPGPDQAACSPAIVSGMESRGPRGTCLDARAPFGFDSEPAGAQCVL